MLHLRRIRGVVVPVGASDRDLESQLSADMPALCGLFLCPVGREDAPQLSQAHAHHEAKGGVLISVEPRINDRIRVPEVRLIGPNGEQVGIISIDEAMRIAHEADLDLVEVAPEAHPPVCKIMDYGKFKYEAAVKAREARKNQVNTVIKEVQLTPKIDTHDYETKRAQVIRFLNAGDKVKIKLKFRGREQFRPQLGLRVLAKLAEDIAEVGIIEAAPKQDGRNMMMVIAPMKRKPATAKKPVAAVADDTQD